MNHVGPDDLRIKSLVDRVAAGRSPGGHHGHQPGHRRGDHRHVPVPPAASPFGVKVTRLAYGIPVGSHLEYADDATLMRALEGRREM